MDICVVATLRLIGIELLCTLVCKCLLELLFSVLWGIYLGVEWLAHMLILFNLSRNHFIIFEVRYLKIIQNEAYSLDRIFFFFWRREFSHSSGPQNKNGEKNTHWILTWKEQTQQNSVMCLPRYLSPDLPVHVALGGSPSCRLCRPLDVTVAEWASWPGGCGFF